MRHWHSLPASVRVLREAIGWSAPRRRWPHEARRCRLGRRIVLLWGARIPSHRRCSLHMLGTWFRYALLEETMIDPDTSGLLSRRRASLYNRAGLLTPSSGLSLLYPLRAAARHERSWYRRRRILHSSICILFVAVLRRLRLLLLPLRHCEMAGLLRS